MAEDVRKEFVVSTVLDAVATAGTRDELFMQLASDASGAMRAFLDDQTTMVFQATVSGNRLVSSNVVSFDTGSSCQVVLTKLKAGALTEGDIPANVAVSSMSHSPISALYNQLKRVYGPMMSEGKDGLGVDAKLVSLVAELEAGLGNHLRLTGGVPSVSGAVDPATAPLVGIVTPLDEIKMWSEVAFSDAAPARVKASASAVYRALEPLKSRLENLHTNLNDEDVLDLVDAVSDCLDQAWNAGDGAFAQRRAAHFMRCVGVCFVGHAQDRLRKIHVWVDKWKSVEPVLRFTHRMLGKWETVVHELTAMLWADGGSTRNAWLGAPFTDATTTKAKARIDEVFKMREAQAELTALLTKEERRSLTLAEVFAPFAGLDPLQVSTYVAPLWDAALSDYDARMLPVETRISEKLREHFGARLLPSLAMALLNHEDPGADASPQPHQVFREVMKYTELLRRPAVARALDKERAAVADGLDKFLSDVKTWCDTRSASLLMGQTHKEKGQTRTGRNTTEVIEGVVWCVQFLERVATARSAASALVARRAEADGDFEADAVDKRGTVLQQEIEELCRELLELKNTLFVEWQESIVEHLGDFKLDLGSKLMDLDASASGNVKLHYNSELVSLLREVRQLTALGFTVRKDIAAEAETARKFYRHGMVLRQVANFYNNIASEMIFCQKPMMLDEAVRFESVLTNPKDGLGQVITWNNPTALETYISKLQGVAGTLTDKNRRLRKWHRTLAEKVTHLFSNDLVRQKEAWKRGVKEIRTIFATLEPEFRKELQSAWRVHWDYQLYKALEYQYHRGLETLNDVLPTMNVSLVFKQRRLQFDPPLEEIRTNHYKQVKDFLNLPLAFKGVSAASEKPGFFRGMVDSPAGAAGCARVYEKTEALFVKLADEHKRYENWVTLGTVDLEAFVETRFQSSEDFENGFALVKTSSKQAERIPAEVRVECYVVSCAPLKSAVEKHIRALQTALSGCLTRKVTAQKETMETFLTTGKDLLAFNAQTIEEIGNTRVAAKKLQEEFGGRITTMRKGAGFLAKLLKQSGGVSSNTGSWIDFSSLDSEWENLSTKLGQLETHLEAQKENLKVQIVRKIDEFRGKAEAFRDRWLEFKPRSMPQGDPTLIIGKLEDDHRVLTEFREEGDGIRRDCEHFSMQRPEFPVLDEVAEDITQTREAWSRLGEFLVEQKSLSQRDWISIRGKLYELDDFLAKWGDKARSDSETSKDGVAVLLLSTIEEYKKAMPALKFCRGEGWESTHWAQLFSLLQFPTKGPEAVTRENLTLQHFLDKADLLIDKMDDLKTLHSQAQGEVTLREALHQLKVWGLDRRFSLVTHAVSGKRGGTVSLIKEWKDLFTEVADNQNLVSSLKDSSFFLPFKDETEVWESTLSTLADRLTAMNAIQRKWLYLQPIFARGALPQEQPRFRRVDEDFQNVMAAIAGDSLVKSFAQTRMRPTHFTEMSAQLDLCQKALAEYLEEKRSMLPRFYFIGDDDLLEILGQAKNPEVIQAHLKKLFAGIHSVVFSEGARHITAMKSIAGEVVPLREPVAVTEAVEVWLADLSESMTRTLSAMLVKCLAEKDYEKFPSQILSLADQVHFSKRCEVAIARGALPALLSDLRDQLQEYTSFDVEGMRVMQLKIQSLVLDLIHSIDVVEQLQTENCSETTNWAWQRQLRYYDNPRGEVTVHMDNGRFSYSNEYQGNAPRLVYTPLTDKCYLTLTQGMHLGYGGNPYGPAGTGKTESVKALGQALGRQVLVFNCDEEFDFKSMGRIFTGLLKCGAWGCFDEFNRLEEEVLSAVSSQIQTIQAALKSKATTMTFMSREIDVNHDAGIFVTLNPAGKGYGGRSKLPDNLKQLFRSVAMTVPNFELIAEVILLSEGFKQARALGRKLVSLFSLSKQLLSPQQHYDWGLRALKTVLGIAGKLLRDARGAGDAVDDAMEAQIVIRATRVTTLPKLTFADGSRFAELLNDVYPGVVVSDVSDATLEAAIREVLIDMHYEDVPSQVEKVLQLHVACSQRIGIIIVGPSGSGKSALWHILEGAYKKLGRPVKRHVMNPKAIHRQQLLGHMDIDTREWFDGVLTDAARQVVKESLEQHSWIICDGDVDPEWIESLNSVLDDNRLLTLPSGERIQFGSNVNFIFECDDLKFASPATVSRTAMLFLSEEAVEPSLIVKGWLVSQSTEKRNKLSAWCDEYFFKALAAANAVATACRTTKVGTIKNALSHLTSADSKAEFARGLARGFGGNMEPAERDDFLSHLTRLTGEKDLLHVAASSIDRYDAPASGIVDGKWKGVVMVDHVAMAQSLVMPWLESGQPFVLVGPEGCGKAMVLEDCFSRLRSTAVASVSCSAQTTASNVIQKLAQCCGPPQSTAGSAHRVLRPKDAERLVLYLKDINLPKPDKYDTIQLIAFLQQLLTYGGFYDDAQEFIGLKNVQIVCSMNPATTVGRHPITTRFTAIAGIAYMAYVPHGEMQTVYAEMFAGFTAASQYASPSQRGLLAQTVLDLYDVVTKTFSADDHRHYKFTPRTITEWIQQVHRYDLVSVDLVEALRYEANRTFRDRLVGPDARAKFDALLADVFSKHWRVPRSNTSTDCVFTTWAGSSGVGDEAGVMSAMPADHFEQHVAAKLVSYEREIKELNILLFPEVLQRVARFNRVLSQPGGHLLLAGKSGVGRRTTCSLVAHAHAMEFVSPKMTLKYDERSFRVDLKKILADVGVDNKETLLYLEDHQLVNSAILETVNSLLSGGEVPGLFTNPELETMYAPLREQMATEGSALSPFEFFTQRVKHKLHVALSMDPSDSQWAVRCESNPALFTRCSVHWMDGWSDVGMRAVPRTRLKEVLASAHASEENGDIVEQMCAIQNMVGGTPRQYVTFVDQYARIFESKREAHVTSKNHLTAGLTKLEEAAGAVAELSVQAAEQQVLLAEKQHLADEALSRITTSMSAASERKKEVETLKEKTSKEEADLNVQKVGIEDELKDVQPLIDSARAAVGQIKSDNINEIKSLRTPPEGILVVLEAVLLLMNNPDTSWAGQKKFLGSRGVKDEIVNFDAHVVTAKNREIVRKILKEKADLFEHKNILRVSVAAAPLAAWVKANVKFSLVLEKIAPLENILKQLTGSLDTSTKRVEECENELVALDLEVVEMKLEFGRRTSEAEALKLNLKKAQDSLFAAERLLGKLGGEKDRWKGQVVSLDADLKALPLNALLAAGFIAYLASSPEDTRVATLGRWTAYLGVGDRPFDLRRFMSTETEMLTWKQQGLPGDTLSMENAIVILRVTAAPLIIDPSNRAVAWLKAFVGADASASLETVAAQDPRFANKLELAVRFGKTLILEEVDCIEPILYPVVRKDLWRVGARFAVAVGDKTVEYNENFKMFLVTRNPYPVIPPSAASVIAPVNFTVTRSGLLGQLLGLVIQHEQPTLEAQKTNLLRVEEDLKTQLAGLEKTLLGALAASTGNILENEALLQSLDETKAKGTTVSESLLESTTLQQSLDTQRDSYRPVAAQGSKMFFLTRDLKALNHTYQFSLNSFIALFKRALEESAPSSDLDRRIDMLSHALLRLVFGHVSRSIFNHDRLTFGMHFARHLAKTQADAESWNFYFGLDAGDAGGRGGGAVPRWVPAEIGRRYGKLVSAFPAIADAYDLDDEGKWSDWLRLPNAETRVPSGGQLDKFAELLLVQAMRPDRLASAMSSFVCGELGVESIAPAPLSMHRVCEEASAASPVLFIVTPGSDPSQELEEHASSRGKGRYHQLAMGQGQAEEALRLLHECAKSGDWLCLKNLHLVVSWLPNLEKEIYVLDAHREFRLFFTSEAHDKFPSSLLEGCLKVTYEAPPGLKRNVQRTYEAWSPTYISDGTPLRAKLLFLLAWFHAVVQERRAYVPQGWSKFYEFSFADLRSGADIIDQACQHGSNPQWSQLHGLLERAIYGGRVDSAYDIVVLRTYLRQFFSGEMTGGGGVRVRSLPGTDAQLPQTANHRDFVALLRTLDDGNSPSLFSLPVNVDRTVQIRHSEHVIASLRLMATAAGTALGFDRVAWSVALAPLLRAWDRLMEGNPGLRDLQRPAHAHISGTQLSPVDAFVELERARGQRLLEEVDDTLAALGKTLGGQTPLTPKSFAAGALLMQGAVPGSWDKLWEGPEEPVGYCKAVVARMLAVNALCERCQSGALLSKPVTLDDFFHPETFLNALRQQSARESGVAIDNLVLVTSWDLNSMKTGVVVEGLRIQGAVFDGERLNEPAPDARAFQNLQRARLAWLPPNAPGAGGPRCVGNDLPLSVPLYLTAAREKAIAEVQFPIFDPEETARWVLAGTACFAGGD
jgi:dynein heavy chain 2